MKNSWSAATDPGLRRHGNEDSYCARPELGLYVVADGMGGHAAGEVASRVAVEAMQTFIDDTKGLTTHDTLPFPFDPELSLEANRLRGAFHLANRRIAETMAGSEGLKGMATTAAAILVTSEVTIIGHVGDSRVYVGRKDHLERLTLDHSWVEEQVRAGVLTASAARQHPWRNVVTRALAGGDDPQVDLVDFTPAAGDRILLCSDGLFSVVTDEEIGELLGAAGPLENVCQALITAANDAGGPDNITVLVLQIDAP
jgi:protein phosphatase